MIISQEESGALERLKIISLDRMVVSEERLCEFKPREENLLHSNAQCTACTCAPPVPLGNPMPRYTEPEPAASSRRTVLAPTVSGVRPEQQSELRRDRPRRAAAVEADKRMKTWLQD